MDVYTSAKFLCTEQRGAREAIAQQGRELQAHALVCSAVSAASLTAAFEEIVLSMKLGEP